MSILRGVSMKREVLHVMHHISQVCVLCLFDEKERYRACGARANCCLSHTYLVGIMCLESVRKKKYNQRICLVKQRDRTLILWNSIH